MGLSASAVERGYVLLQAAVAEGALGDIQTAYGRIGELLDLDDAALLVMARVCAEFIGRISPWGPQEWTRVLTDAGDQVNLDQVTEARRVSSLRMLAAYGAGDEAMFDALFHAAADPERRRMFVGDLFELTIDRAEMSAESAGNPRTVVRQLCEAISRHLVSPF